MKLKKIWIAALGIAVIAVGGIYAGKAIHYQNKGIFMSNTTFSGIDIGGKTIGEATKAVNTALSNRKFTISENKKSVGQFSAQSAGIIPHTKKALALALKNQNTWAWPFHTKSVEATSSNVSMDSVNEATMNKLTNSIISKTSQNRVATKNANLVYKDDKFSINKELQGTQISKSRLSHVILTAFQSGKTSINLNDAYVKPTVTSKSQKLKEAKTQATKLSEISITYHLAGHTIVVPKSQISTWITFDNDKISINQAKLVTYLKSLNSKYATITKTRSFKSTKRGTVKVKAGLYGWSIKTSSEAKALSKLILAGKTISRTPIIQGSGYHKNGSDIGNSYVEVDKKNQHMWVYKNGKVVVSTAVVTGKPKKGTTPSGVWYVWNKQRNATLRGYNDDGSKYASKVSYWMPVDDTGVGIHDSSWQPKYGGTWYLTHGSHGRVNTPPSVMGKVYKYVSIGTPVIIF